MDGLTRWMHNVWVAAKVQAWCREAANSKASEGAAAEAEDESMPESKQAAGKAVEEPAAAKPAPHDPPSHREESFEGPARIRKDRPR